MTTAGSIRALNALRVTSGQTKFSPFGDYKKVVSIETLEPKASIGNLKGEFRNVILLRTEQFEYLRSHG